MERESFSHPAVAAVLNASFVPIKLDREERPDIDRIYMNYVSATTSSGGWPLNVFLTPDLRPLFGGTYWPGPGATLAHRDHVTFEAILHKMERVWSHDRARCQSEVETVLAQLENWAHEGRVSKGNDNDPEDAEELDLELLDDAWEHFSARFDSVYGGFGRAPKFPTPAKLDFLLNLSVYPQAVKDVIGDEAVAEARDMAVQTLHAMANGGIKDQIGHGFSRYSVTRDWSLPHFEKMLYDNTQLLHTYTTAYLITRNPLLLTTALDLAAYLTSAPILSPEGAFLSSEDADSARPGDPEPREGAYYVWTAKEMRALLSDRDASIALNYWGVQDGGNVPRELDAHDELLGQNVLAAVTDVETLAIEFGLGSTQEADAILKRARDALWEHREQKRVRPPLDDKVVVAWNGLAVHALAGLAKVLDGLGGAENERIRLDVLQAAEGAVAFVKKEMADATATMKRVYREGLGDAPAFADDYAFLIAGLIELYEATWDESYLEFADALQSEYHFTMTSLTLQKRRYACSGTPATAASTRPPTASPTSCSGSRTGWTTPSRRRTASARAICSGSAPCSTTNATRSRRRRRSTRSRPRSCSTRFCSLACSTPSSWSASACGATSSGATARRSARSSTRSGARPAWDAPS